MHRKFLAVGIGLAALAALVGYAQAGSGTRPRPEEGIVRFIGTTDCSLDFSFHGFPAGSPGELKVYDTQKALIHEFDFAAPPLTGTLSFDVSPYLTDDQKNDGADVGFRVDVRDERQGLAGYADLLCPLAAPPAVVTTTPPAFTG